MARSLSDLGVSSEADGRETGFCQPANYPEKPEIEIADSNSRELHKAKKLSA
jgi:hypothetical protein